VSGAADARPVSGAADASLVCPLFYAWSVDGSAAIMITSFSSPEQPTLLCRRSSYHYSLERTTAARITAGPTGLTPAGRLSPGRQNPAASSGRELSADLISAAPSAQAGLGGDATPIRSLHPILPVNFFSSTPSCRQIRADDLGTWF